MNKFNFLLVFGTSVNVFCGCYGVALKDVIIDGLPDITYHIKDLDSVFEHFQKNDFKCDRNQIATDIRIFALGNNKILIVFKTTVYSKQDDEAKKKCIKLPDGDLYAYFPRFSEEEVKKVTITKDDKVKGKYKVTIL